MSLLLLGFLATWLTVKNGSLLDPRNADAVNMLGLGILALVGVIAAVAMLVKPPIRAKQITDQGVILTGVAESFPGATSQS